ncbi:oligosaccharide flippase family protein [Marinobacter sp.]|uniref:oligosaccharide flippase family protein n=1 Tax=Marinobacter sp. TaxID=50741 RepID=UPI0035C6CC7B
MLRLLLINTGSNVLLMVVKMALTFIMTPILIHNLGNYDYGLWEMVAAVLGYMGMLDLGIKPAISRFAAKYKAEEDQLNLQTVFASTLVFMAAIGFLIALALAGWGVLFSGAMAPEGEDPLKYTLFLLILAGQMLIVFPGYVAESYLEGFQRYNIKNNITIVNSLIGAVLFIAFVAPDNALLLLAAVNAVGLSVKFLIYGFLLTRASFGRIVFNLALFNGRKLRELMAFGFKSFVQGVATRMENATDTLVIGSFLGPAAVPFYSIPQNLVRYIQTLGWTLSHAFMPLFSDLAARSENDKIQGIYLVASKIVVGLVMAMGIGAAIVGTPFLALWIGTEYTEQSDIILLLLVSFTVLPLINPFSSRYLTAIGKHGIFARLMPISAVVNLGLSLLLVQYYGVVGVAVASLLPSLVLQPVLLVYSCRQLEVPVATYLRESLLPNVLPLLLMGAVTAWMRWGVGINSYLLLVITVLLAIVVFCLSFWCLSFNPQERSFVLERSPLRRST